MKDAPITVYSFADAPKATDLIDYHDELGKLYDDLDKEYINHIEAEQEARSVYQSMIG